MDTIIVFDVDGVLVEVSESYRQSIVETVAHFTGKRIELDSIQDYKNQGGWNNDWALSQKIASDLGVAVPFDQVVQKFNELFLGRNGDGLILREQWIPQAALLNRLGQTREAGRAGSLPLRVTPVVTDAVAHVVHGIRVDVNRFPGG